MQQFLISLLFVLFAPVALADNVLKRVQIDLSLQDTRVCSEDRVFFERTPPATPSDYDFLRCSLEKKRDDDATTLWRSAGTAWVPLSENAQGARLVGLGLQFATEQTRTGIRLRCGGKLYLLYQATW
jgi:hypothetical protein